MLPKIPLVEVGPQEEAAPDQFGGALPGLSAPQPLNFADDEDVEAYVQGVLLPTMAATVEARSTLEAEWNAIRRMELQVHDEGRTYFGPSNMYLPLYSKAITTRVSAFAQGLFPTDDYMDVAARSGDPLEGAKADAVKTYLQWEFERVAKAPQVIKVGLRSLQNFGNVVYKVWYEKKLQKQVRGQRGVPVDYLSPVDGTAAYAPLCEGMQVSVRPLHNVYFYPYTASTQDEVSLTFETIKVPRWKVESLGKAGRWKNWEQALEAQDAQQRHMWNEDEQLSASRVHSDAQPPQRDSILTEVWTVMPVPKKALMEGEEEGEPVAVRLLLAGNVILEATRNPYWHQRSPYLLGRTNVQPGFIYGYGVGRVVRDLQYLANDAANQGNDCATYVLNPVNKVVPGLVAGPLLPLKPGRTWYFNDLAGQAFDRPPTDLIGASQQMLTLWTSMVADYSGAPPVLQGTGARGAAKTATGASILQRNALNPLQDEVEDFERDVLEPMMWMAWMNAQQYRTSEVFIKVAGVDLRFDPAWLQIDPSFRWMASSQAANQFQRAQQGLQLIQVLAGLAQPLAAQGKQVDFEILLKRLAIDGFGYRGFENVIKPAPPPMLGAPGAEGSTGVPPPEEQEGLPRSAIPGESAYTPMEAGEGGDFGEVRAAADQQAAFMGESYGGGLL